MVTQDESPIPARGRAVHRKRRSSRGRLALGACVCVVLVGAALGIYALTSGSGDGAAPRGSSSPTTTVATTSPSTNAPATTTAPTSTSTPTSTTIAPAVAAVPADDVLVEVLNGTGAPDLAATTAQALRSVGFHINGTADETALDYTTSIVAYAPGNEAYAEAVAQHVSGATRLVSDSDISESFEVDFIVGSDFHGVIGT